MYKYINLLCVPIFLMSLYILLAKFSVKKDKKDKIVIFMIIFVISYKILLLLKNLPILAARNITIISAISSALIIFEINKRFLKKHSTIFVSYVQISISCLTIGLVIYSGKEFYINLFIYMIIATNVLLVLMNMKSKKDKQIVKSNIILFMQTLLVLINYLYIEVRLSNLLLNILDLTFSIYIFSTLTKRYLINSYIKKIEIKKLATTSINDVIKIKEKLSINKNITKVIGDNINKKQGILELILNECNQCTFLINESGYIISKDDSFVKMWKNYDSENLKLKLIDFVRNNIKDKDKFMENIMSIKSIETEIEDEVEGSDGRFFKCKYIRLGMGLNQVGIICVLEDITYKKTNQMKIEENNSRYKNIIDNIPYSILLTDSQKILYNNDKSKYINFNDKYITNIILKKSVAGEIYYNTTDEGRICLNINRVDFYEEKEERSLIVARDISEYKRLQEKLNYSKEKYESLVNLIPEGIYIHDYEEKELNYVNKKLRDMLGSSKIKKYLLEKEKKSLIIHNKDAYESIKFSRCIVEDKCDEPIHIEQGSMTIDVNEKLKTVGIVRDITDQVKTEIMEKEIEEQRVANKIKNEFFINMSHELKTPLNLIHSSNQLLECMYKKKIKDDENAELFNSITVVKKNIYILKGLIDNIIDLAKLKSDLRETEKDNYNIVTIVEEISSMFNSYISRLNMNIVFDTDEEEIIANVNAEDIETIILTLLSTVVRYSLQNSTIYVNITKTNNHTIISINNKSNYDCKKYMNDTQRRNLDIGLMVSKSLVNLYNGSIDIAMNNTQSIEVTLSIMNLEDVFMYNERVRRNTEEHIFAEYTRLCNF